VGDHFLFYDGGEDYETINPVGRAKGTQKTRGEYRTPKLNSAKKNLSTYNI
jgi:hypothetical protein